MEEILKQDKSKSLKEFEKLLFEDLKLRKFAENEIISGTVEEIGKKYIFVNVGLKSSGAIPIEEFKRSGEFAGISVGAKVEVLLERIENKDGGIQISLEKCKRMKSWTKMKKAYDNGDEVNGTVLSRCKGGYVANVESVVCFVPSSQLDLRPLKSIDHLVKKPLTFQIVKMDDRRGNIVLSRRIVLSRIRDKDKEKYMKDLKEGIILKDCVCKTIQSWGAFFSYGSLDLLVHINEISWSRVATPSDLLQVGQTCDVFLHKIEGTRLSGSLKRLQPDPFIEAVKKYKPGDIVENCVVNQIREYGAFVSVTPNLVGLVHVSCLDHLNPNIHPSKVLSVSQKISVKILSLDVKERKLSLSYKDCFPSPWITFKKKYKAGSIVNCKIKTKNDYAIFCFIEDTPIVGMLHLSNLAWDSSKREEQLKRWHKNDILRCKIYEINDEKMRTQLSLKHMEDDPFDFLMNKNIKVSDIITVIVQSTTQNGIYVQVGKKNLKILIKKNQLAKEIENQRPSRWTPGQKQDVIITELDKKEKKVSLSIKVLEEKQAKENIKRFGSKDSGGVLSDIFDFSRIKTKKPKSKK